jgi:hypothetical protein
VSSWRTRDHLNRAERREAVSRMDRARTARAVAWSESIDRVLPSTDGFNSQRTYLLRADHAVQQATSCDGFS